MISLRYKGTVAGYRKYARPEILKAAMRGSGMDDETTVRRIQRGLDKAEAMDAAFQARDRRRK